MTTQWKCSNCGYTFGAEKPPEECPSCKEKCAFMDVSCYTPECGGPGNIDPRLTSGKGQAQGLADAEIPGIAHGPTIGADDQRIAAGEDSVGIELGKTGRPAG